MEKNVQTVTRVRLIASLGPCENARVSGDIEIDLSAELGGKPLDVVVRLADKLGIALGQLPPQEIERLLAIRREPTPPPKKPVFEAELLALDAPTDKPIKLANEVVIGRSKTCQVAVPSAKVSRQHARLLATGDAHVLEDLGSANHTFKNGERVEEPVQLADGDEIAVGDVIFRYRVVAGRPKAANGVARR